MQQRTLTSNLDTKIIHMIAVCLNTHEQLHRNRPGWPPEQRRQRQRQRCQK